MRCLWCHNPESIHPEPELLYRPRNCISCGHCVNVCKSGAHRMQDELHIFDPVKCTQCFACADVCFSGAMTKVGQDRSVDEVLLEVEQDMEVYRRSGGGVTLSGGEAMLQSDSVREILIRCKAQGISTAVETNLSVSWKTYEAILPYTDILFFDIKHADDKKHRQWTGAGNAGIKENLRKVQESGVSFAVRTPVIPGFNDDEESIRTIAELIFGSEHLLYYELLTYNPLGNAKGILVHPPEILSFPVPSREQMQRLTNVAAEYPICVRLDGLKIGENDG